MRINDIWLFRQEECQGTNLIARLLFQSVRYTNEKLKIDTFRRGSQNATRFPLPNLNMGEPPIGYETSSNNRVVVIDYSNPVTHVRTANIS